MKRITIQDIAKLLSLNPSTVSRALSDHKDVNEETRKRVLAVAKEFNYVPNLHARYFRMKNSGLIALILPEFNMFFTHSIMSGINKVLTEKNFTLIVFYSNNSHQREVEIIRHCISWVVEGVLLVVSNETENLDHLNELSMAEIPVVLFDKVIPNDKYTTITIDDIDVARSAVNHIIDSGSKNIVGIFAKPMLYISQQRSLGFQSALDYSGISGTSVFINDVKEMDQSIANIDFTSYDGIFMMSDELMINLLGALNRRSIQPFHFKMAAISDGVLPKNISPFVPHMLHSGLEVGQIAAEELINDVLYGTKVVKQIKVQTSLISEP
jgi:LacI family transcriptional regulator